MFTCTCNFFVVIFTVIFILIINSTIYYQIIKSNKLHETLPRIWEISDILNCDCNLEGSVFVECNSKVNCFCKTNVTGIKCANCHPGFYGFPDCKGKTKLNLN